MNIPNQWDEQKASSLSPLESLVYRSRLLGEDKRITNYGGGNTSSKIAERNPLTGNEEEVLWVKGSGGDLGSIEAGGFASFVLSGLHSLEKGYPGLDREDEMVELARHATYNLNPRVGSIDTPLHAFLPYPEIDHLHPDSIIAIACSADGEAIMRKIFGETMTWVPWQRPGFDLGLKVRAAVEAAGVDTVRGLILGGHGLMTWGKTSKDCYDNTVEVINKAAAWLEANRIKPAFGGTHPKYKTPLTPEERREVVIELAPRIRGKVSTRTVKALHFSDDNDVLEFVTSKKMSELSALGTSCPDHFLRTKRVPLVLEIPLPRKRDAAWDAEVDTALEKALVAYRDDYAKYYERNKDEASPAMRDANAVIFLVPGVGLLSFAVNKQTARIAAEFFTNAIHVIQGAEGVSKYVGLAEREAFRIEYWKLEEDKLQRLPPPLPLSGQVALVTGGAGGIGQAVCRKFLTQGANVVLADWDESALEKVSSELSKDYGVDRVRGVTIDVTKEEAVIRGMNEAIFHYGGIDILVANAGMASAEPFVETTIETWEKNLSVLATGYFLASREAFKIMVKQGRGGSIIFVASKNALVASGGASAYCTAKAAELHLCRCIALEGAPNGIRANAVNPDAVLRGSKIWSGEWREQRAQAYAKKSDELEEHYRERSLLKRSVFPEDIAEAVYFFAGEQSAKSTGNILNVDAGNSAAFTR